MLTSRFLVNTLDCAAWRQEVFTISYTVGQHLLIERLWFGTQLVFRILKYKNNPLNWISTHSFSIDYFSTESNEYFTFEIAIWIETPKLSVWPRGIEKAAFHPLYFQALSLIRLSFSY